MILGLLFKGPFAAVLKPMGRGAEAMPSMKVQLKK